MSIFISIALLHFLAQLTPGPDILLIGKVAMSKGKQAAIMVIAGITAGIAIWITITLTGFSLILERWSWIQSLMMLLGAFFLSKMGWAMLKSGIYTLRHQATCNTTSTTEPTIEPHNVHYFLQGLFTNLANPKALVYFASVFSLALQSTTIQQIKLSLGLMIVIETFVIFVLLAWIISTQRIRHYYQQAECYIDIIAGVFFIGFAMWLLYDATPTLFQLLLSL